MKQKVAIIGSGFSGLSSASMLAKAGFEVDVYEKNNQTGGRASKLESSGFTFDMGPTWYWMPDVFERFFQNFGLEVNDLYDLKRLDPSYRMYFGKDDYIDVPASVDKLYALFEQIEPGSSLKLKKFLSDAEYKYNIGIKEIVYKPSDSIFEYFNWKLLKGITKLDFFQSLSSYVRARFHDPRLIKILEFPVIFLGATPSETPALYSMMNYADLSLGTWYPMGGMNKVVQAMTELSQSLGARIHLNHEVERISVKANRIDSLVVNDKMVSSDFVIASGDYHHIEQNMVPLEYQTYNESYWDKRKLAPSALLFFLGVDRKIPNLLHHNLFFDRDFEKHAEEIYKDPKWPTDPAIYVSVSSVTDYTVAPAGCENLIVLIPVAPGLKDTDVVRENYYQLIMDRLESITGVAIKPHIIYKKIYAQRDFESDYYAYKGNAYGLANTLLQTAVLKPKMKSKKLHNLFYCGQLTVPGPGVPPSIISGQIAANLVVKQAKKQSV